MSDPSPRNPVLALLARAWSALVSEHRDEVSRVNDLNARRLAAAIALFKARDHEAKEALAREAAATTRALQLEAEAREAMATARVFQLEAENLAEENQRLAIRLARLAEWRDRELSAREKLKALLLDALVKTYPLEEGKVSRVCRLCHRSIDSGPHAEGCAAEAVINDITDTSHYNHGSEDHGGQD